MRVVIIFFNDTATTEIYTLSLHDALPISCTGRGTRGPPSPAASRSGLPPTLATSSPGRGPFPGRGPGPGGRADRKSTRLNSSHANISYAVFCLKKKNLYLFFTPPTPFPSH